jgi:hypothetical protein
VTRKLAGGGQLDARQVARLEQSEGLRRRRKLFPRGTIGDDQEVGVERNTRLAVSRVGPEDAGASATLSASRRSSRGDREQRQRSKPGCSHDLSVAWPSHSSATTSSLGQLTHRWVTLNHLASASPAGDLDDDNP